MPEEVEKRVSNLELRVNSLEKDIAVSSAEFIGVKATLLEIKSSLTWVTRLIIGALLLALVAFITGGGLILA